MTIDKKRPRVAIDFSTAGKGGGPFTSSTRIVNSELKSKYEFHQLSYKIELGRRISLRRIFDLRNQLKYIKPDIVHFTGLQLAGFHIIIACWLAGIKNTVVTVRGFSGDALDVNFFLRMILTIIIEPLTLLLSKRIYGVSKYVVSRKMIRLFSYKCYGAIYNFPPLINDNTKPYSIREDLGLSKTDVVAVSVARITKDKGYHILEVVIKSTANLNNLKYVIVGDGNYLESFKENLRDLIQDKRVFVLGFRSNVQQILKECDFFILPTLHETLSVALLEASVAALPMIASNTGGVPEIVIDEYNGLLVTPGCILELKNAVQRLYNSSQLRTLFGKNAIINLNNRFTQKKIEDDIDKVYKSLLV